MSHDFDDLLHSVTEEAGRFGHREHVRLTWQAVRERGTVAATDLVSQGIQRTATYAGHPQKYHATVSRAWVELVGHHVDHDSSTDFEIFAAHNPELLDKRLLSRFYESSTLAGSAARVGWVEPDRADFPWRP